jgi:hypothetical protein
MLARFFAIPLWQRTAAGFALGIVAGLILRERAEVRTLEDGKGEVQVEHLTELPVDTLDAAMHLIECAKRARVTHANAVHADSSRSHAVLQLLIRSALPHEVENLSGAAKVAGSCMAWASLQAKPSCGHTNLSSWPPR